MTDASVLRPDLSLVLERITDGFFALDAEWRIAYMNAEARKMLHAPDNCLGSYWLEAFPKARGRLFEREYTRAMRDQQPVQFVEYSKTANTWFEVKAYPSPDGISVYFRDVSARIEAQREIERNARRAQALIDFGRTALSGHDPDAVVVDALEVLREMLDTPIVEMLECAPESHAIRIRHAIGWGTGASFDPAHPMLAHAEYAVKTGEPFVCTDVRIDSRTRALSPLQHNRVLSCIAVLVGTPQVPLGVIICYHPLTRTFSVGDVRFAQSIAQTVAEALSAFESNRRMGQVLESIRDAFVAVDREMRITYVNTQMARYWGVRIEKMIGSDVSAFIERFDVDGSAMSGFRASLTDGRPRTLEVFFRSRWYEARLYPFADGIAAYVRDVTRRRTEQQRILDLNADLERRVADRTKQLEIANKELESFSYSVSHDLRAPLRAIDGFSQALAEDYGDVLDERASGYLDRVRRAAQRMADLIDALLRLAKVARATLTFSDLDLRPIAEAVVADLRESDPDRNVTVEIESGLFASGEPNLLRAVLQNLIGNAWKFTRNTAEARITVGRTETGEFFVADNGAGFDMAYANKLFGAFQRLHSTDDYEGTGIGLATVARIVHRHGGTIRAEGAIDRGATFYFTLPPARGR